MDLSVVFLCAGYGTRLERDIQSCGEGSVGKSLAGLPKALLPIGGKALIAHWIDVLDRTEVVDRYYLVTNDRFYNQFQSFSKPYKGKITVLNDGTDRNENRMGAVASINFAIDKFGLINSDILVVGGDTLFKSEFCIRKFLEEFLRHKKALADCSLVTTYQCNDNDTTKYGILEIDETMKAKSFLEKPKPNETSSRLACPCFYLFSSSCCLLIKDFLESKKDAPMIEKDATGNLIKFLLTKCSIFTYPISGRFDVGGLQSYEDCNNYFTNLQ